MARSEGMRRRTFPNLLAARLTLLLALALTLTTGGCAWTQEERDFYGRGWLNPRELDRPVPRRGPRPVGGELTTDNTSPNPWTAPGTAIDR